jgi:transposase
MERAMTSSKKTASKAKGRKAKASGTKLQLLEEMLRRPEGGTILQLSKALGWEAHSVRGAISGALKKQLRLAVISGKAEGEDRVYRIVG